VPTAAEQAYWDAKLAKLELRITAWEDAMVAFASDGLQQSYTLDTGQDRVTVERAEVSVMQRTLDSMYRQRDFMMVRACRMKPGYHGRPSW
jgi:hypothetical protein